MTTTFLIMMIAFTTTIIIIFSKSSPKTKGGGSETGENKNFLDRIKKYQDALISILTYVMFCVTIGLVSPEIWDAWWGDLYSFVASSLCFLLAIGGWRRMSGGNLSFVPKAAFVFGIIIAVNAVWPVLKHSFPKKKSGFKKTSMTAWSEKFVDTPTDVFSEKYYVADADTFNIIFENGLTDVMTSNGSIVHVNKLADGSFFATDEQDNPVNSLGKIQWFKLKSADGKFKKTFCKKREEF